MNRRFPKGYLGLDHTTQGGDVLAVLETVNRPELILGPELARELRSINRHQWYPVTMMLDLLDRLDAKLGAYHLKQVGWTIFSKYQAEEFRKHVHSAEEAMRDLDPQYRKRNRGTSIGGWRVEHFGNDHAEVVKTTPHHCLMEEGILEEVMRTLGVPCTVRQSQCFRQGADNCHFIFEPKFAGSDRWWAEGSQPR